MALQHRRGVGGSALGSSWWARGLCFGLRGQAEGLRGPAQAPGRPYLPLAHPWDPQPGGCGLLSIPCPHQTAVGTSPPGAFPCLRHPSWHLVPHRPPRTAGGDTILLKGTLPSLPPLLCLSASSL